MAEPAAPDTTPLEYHRRLAQKAGVQATLILSRVDGAIVQSSGLQSIIERNPSNSSTKLDENRHSETKRKTEEVRAEMAEKTVEEIARTAWHFFEAAEKMAAEIEEGKDGKEEVRLIRMRLSRREVVIVPDKKFLLVVLHDTPPS